MKAIQNIDQVDEYIEHKNVISFDLFDTLVYRSSIKLDEVLSISSSYGSILLKKACDEYFTSGEFLVLRKKATAKLKMESNSCGQEPSLNHVFQRIFLDYGVTNKEAVFLAEKLVRFELDLELSTLKVHIGVLEYLRKLKLSDKSVIIISDMYFSKRDIIEILKATSLFEYIDFLFVSSEHGCTKRGGPLFTKALNILNLKPNHMVHIGDNVLSDIKSATKFGIQAVYFAPTPNATKYPTFREPSISPVAKLVLSFASQVAINALKNELRRVYFLSRDATGIGKVFEVAKIKSRVFRSLCLGVEVRNLAVSRSSLVFLNWQHGNEFLFSVFDHYLGAKPKGYYLSEMMEVLGVQLSSSGFVDSQVLTRQHCSDFAKNIEANEPSLGEDIVAAAFKHKDAAISYLRQELVLDTDDSIGLVDIGYSGSIGRVISTYAEINCMDDLRENHSKICMMLMCSGNSGTLHQANEPSNLVYTAPSLSKKNISYLQTLNFSWLEIFFQSSSKGVLSRYAGVNGIWFPQFDVPQSENLSVDKWVTEIGSALEQGLPLERYLLSKYSKSVARNFAKTMSSPSRELVSEIRKIRYAYGALDKENISIIDNELTFLSAINPYKIRSAARGDIWVEGSLKAANMSWLKLPVSLLARIYVGLNSALKR